MPGDRFSLDTNILIYAVDGSEGAKHERAVEIVDRSTECDCVLTIQALAEFTSVVARHASVETSEATAQVREWLQIFPTVSADASALDLALEQLESRKFAFWDALLLATARQAGCRTLLSEDMHAGAEFDGLVVRNPLVGETLPTDLRALLGFS